MDWLSDWLIDWAIDWLIDCSIDWLIDRSIDFPITLVFFFVQDDILTFYELKHLYEYKFCDPKPSIPFTTTRRQPQPQRAYLILDLVSDAFEDPSSLSGRVDLEIFSDLVPLTSHLFLENLAVRCLNLRYGAIDFRDSQDGHQQYSDEPFPDEDGPLRAGSLTVALEAVDAAAMRIRVSHPGRATQKPTEGVVFGRVIKGGDALKRLEMFREAFCQNEGETSRYRTFESLDIIRIARSRKAYEERASTPSSEIGIGPLYHWSWVVGNDLFRCHVMKVFDGFWWIFCCLFFLIVFFCVFWWHTSLVFMRSSVCCWTLVRGWLADWVIGLSPVSRV